MTTKIFTIRQADTNHPQIAEAASILKQGGLVAFPTETVYGLGGDATDKNAAKKIYAAKGRPSDNPLIIHIEHPEEAERYAQTCDAYYRLAKAFMPGPLTVILPKKDTVPYETTGGLDTVAIRCPSHPIARALIHAAGRAIAAPSANLSGTPSPSCGEHVIRDMTGRIDAIIDGGECEIGLESTIIQLKNGEAVLLRPGAITADALSCVCDAVTVAPSVTESLKENENPLSPGMKYRHYAPKIPLILLEGEADQIIHFLRRAQNRERCTILCYCEELPLLRNERLIDIGSEGDLAAQAHTLFAALRQADDLDCDVIYAHLPPKDGMGLALYNRMLKASAYTVIYI